MPFFPHQSIEQEFLQRFHDCEMSAIPDFSVFRSLLATPVKFSRKNLYLSRLIVLRDDGF